jgi:tetratricopeptide (TPR) repeat protein
VGGAVPKAHLAALGFSPRVATPARGETLMLRYLKTVFWGLTYPARVSRRRPRAALLLAGFVLAAAALAGGWYVRHQWRAAQAALVQDRPQEAQSRLEVCLFVWPRDPEVHRVAARAARLSGDIPAAEALLNECLKLHGGATEAVQLEFLLLRVQAGELDEVGPTLLDSVEKGNPESPIILETLARAYMHRFRYKWADACLSRWIELRPESAKAYQWRGWVLERLNDHKAARADYLRALDLAPDLTTVRLRVAEMFLEDSEPELALPHLERLHRQEPDRPELQALLGVCRFIQGRLGEARRLLEAAAVHLPDQTSVLIHLARIDLQEGRAADAEGRLRKVLRADPSDTEALFILAAVLRLQGRADEAAATLKEYDRWKVEVDRVNKLLREVADSPAAQPPDYAELGTLLLHVGREKPAVYWLNQALQRDPGNQAAHQALTAYYEKKGDHEQAAAHRRQLIQPIKAAAPR